MQHEKERQPWVSMRLRTVGNIADIVQGGGGKLSLAGGDPGDQRKPTGQG